MMMTTMSRHSLASIISLMLGVPVFCQTTPSPSMTETFDWMTNTLKLSEGNTTFTHRPTARPYVKDWLDKEIDPYHAETIEKFTHDGCRVTFEVEMIDNDMGFLLGKYFLYHAVDTFDLKDIDPQSVRIQNSCAPVTTPSGPVEPWNCEDTQGKIVVFQTRDAKPTIHEEGSGSSGKSNYGIWGVQHHMKFNLDEMCTQANSHGDAGNGAYCDEPEKKQTPKDLTSSTLGFTTPAYANRFAKALRHAVELCGGKSSTF
jgi:hypothetical protein